jgi:ATP-dependent DNA helicase RecG
MPQDRLPVKTFLVLKTNTISATTGSANKSKPITPRSILFVLYHDSDEMQTVKSAESEFEKLKQIYPEYKLALIHGKIAPKTRDKIISDFKDNKINILVTTPIIEVGIDIPNASIIIIQSADHFGLAQLHQLRGRVGRGQHQSYCYLFTQSTSQNSIDRLHHLELHHNGLKIAEYDLKTRGPEKFFHISSMGFLLSNSPP